MTNTVHMKTTARFTRYCSALLFATCTLEAEAADNPRIAFDYDLTVAAGSFAALPTPPDCQRVV